MTARDDEVTKLPVERLRAFVRSVAPGQCKILSRGDYCECPLCDIDRLAALAYANAQQCEARVPREPTAAMLDAGSLVFHREQQKRIPKWEPAIAARFWRAMYDAALRGDTMKEEET